MSGDEGGGGGAARAPGPGSGEGGGRGGDVGARARRLDNPHAVEEHVLRARVGNEPDRLAGLRGAKSPAEELPLRDRFRLPVAQPPAQAGRIAHHAGHDLRRERPHGELDGVPPSGHETREGGQLETLVEGNATGVAALCRVADFDAAADKAARNVVSGESVPERSGWQNDHERGGGWPQLFEQVRTPDRERQCSGTQEGRGGTAPRREGDHRNERAREGDNRGAGGRDRDENQRDHRIRDLEGVTELRETSRAMTYRAAKLMYSAMATLGSCSMNQPRGSKFQSSA